MNRTEACHDGVEHVQQHKHTILIIVQCSLIRLVSPALVVVESLKHWLNHFEILQTLDILALELGFVAGRLFIGLVFRSRHSVDDRSASLWKPRRILCRNGHLPAAWIEPVAWIIDMLHAK